MKRWNGREGVVAEEVEASTQAAGALLGAPMPAAVESPPLVGQYCSVNVSEAVFESVELGARHELTIVVRNTSIRGRRVRFTPPRSPAFALMVENDVELAPGLELRAELCFFSNDPKDFEDKLVISVGRNDVESEVLTVPVKAFQPCARIDFPKTLDFGPVVHGSTVVRKLTVTNRGTRKGTVTLPPPGSPGQVGARFKMVPLQVCVPPGGETEVKVEFTAVELGAATLKVPIHTAGGTAPPEVKLMANAVTQSLELRDARGKPMPKVEFGRLYCGLTRVLKTLLHNDGPETINWTVSKGRSEGDEAAAEDDDAACPMLVSPTMGSLPPYTSMPVELTFAPPRFDAGATEEEADDVIVTQVCALPPPPRLPSSCPPPPTPRALPSSPQPSPPPSEASCTQVARTHPSGPHRGCAHARANANPRKCLVSILNLAWP